MRVLAIGGRTIRVSVREGTAGWPPLLLCNGIGASLELFQPFVDALDPRRPVIRFDMPGVGGSPAPVIPYHLATLPSCWPACSTSSATPRPTSWASPGAAGSRSSSR
jgi:pimeloyl-ACP methyl ester carboxylesterase